MRQTLFDRRLLVVTGKGGVGRTTTTIALGLAAASMGKRVCVVEFSGMTSIADAMGVEPSYDPVDLAPNLQYRTFTALDCMNDFGERKLRISALVRVLFDNRIVSAFIDAVPGLPDLFQLGKLENMLMEPLAQDPHWDLAILDAPATGHGLTLLSSASSMSEITRAGPFYDLAHIIERFLDDPALAGVLLTTTPEELPVNESLELLATLRDEGRAPAAVLVNQVRPSPLPPTPPWPDVRQSFAGSTDPDVAVLAALADAAWAQKRAQDAAIDRLRAQDIDLALVPREPDGIDAPALHRLGAALAAQVSP